MRREPLWRDPAFWSGLRRGYVAGGLLTLAVAAGPHPAIAIERAAQDEVRRWQGVIDLG